MQNQNSENAFKKLRLAPKSLAIAAGAGLMMAGAIPGQAYNINDAGVDGAGIDNAMIVASTIVSTTTTSTTTTTTTTTTSTTTSSSSSSSAFAPGHKTVVGTSFYQPSDALDLSTTA